MSSKLSFCLASSRQLAEQIMHRLELEGFSDNRISVIFPDKGALSLPGIGPFIAAGPIVDSLSQVTRKEEAEGLAGGLSGLGMSEPMAERYQDRIEGGSFLLSVHAATCAEADRAARIFAAMGAQEICDLGLGAAGVGSQADGLAFNSAQLYATS